MEHNHLQQLQQRDATNNSMHLVHQELRTALEDLQQSCALKTQALQTADAEKAALQAQADLVPQLREQAAKVTTPFPACPSCTFCCVWVLLHACVSHCLG